MSDGVDASQVLARVVPHRLPAAICARAAAVAGGPVALYVVDVDGSALHLLTGDPALFPDPIRAPLGVGPEIPRESLAALEAALTAALPGAVGAPLMLGDRALGLIACRTPPDTPLDALAEEAALALELGGGYSDATHATRRRRRISPAAEIQQNLLPPRIARVEGADLAGGVLPGYEVGGDFFDYAQNADGLWLALADAVGKGNEAAAIASLAIGALRAARRGGESLPGIVATMNAAVRRTARELPFVTAVVARWEAGSGTLEWITCGHPRPLLVAREGGVRTLDAGVVRPLGLIADGEAVVAARTRLPPGARLVLYSDGFSERRRDDGSLVGADGVARMVARAGPSAPATVRALQDGVIDAAPTPLRDDATVLVMAIDP